MYDVREFTIAQAKAYLKQKGKKSGRFYVNVYGWQTYLTLEPTFATPTGKAKGFKRTTIIKV
jgi:hypothetical protein|tara:strand:+ start:346 stop:531 length:186 start_codon:yes stop_codon:yes gene_type:complete